MTRTLLFQKEARQRVVVDNKKESKKPTVFNSAFKHVSPGGIAERMQPTKPLEIRSERKCSDEGQIERLR